MFNDQLCRSLWLTYERIHNIDGIETYRWTKLTISTNSIIQNQIYTSFISFQFLQSWQLLLLSKCKVTIEGFNFLIHKNFHSRECAKPMNDSSDRYISTGSNIKLNILLQAGICQSVPCAGMEWYPWKDARFELFLLYFSFLCNWMSLGSTSYHVNSSFSWWRSRWN